MKSNSHKQIAARLAELQKDAAFQSSVGNIAPGKFERLNDNPDYVSRLRYTEVLREYVYDPALMNLILTDPALKMSFFRCFGYKGQMEFTIYPNAWIRDLPLLDIGKGAYLGDGIVLGTNQVSIDQKFINVNTIKIGANTIFDQRGAVGYETEIGSNCSLRFDVAIGIKCTIGDNTSVGEKSFIGHGTKIGSQVVVGQGCSIGNMCIIDDDITLDLATTLPAFSHVSKEGITNYRTEDEVSA